MKNIGCCLVFSLLLVGCSDGGPNIASGKRCSKSYAPVDMKVEKGRVEFDALSSGEYNYTGTSFFYEDNLTNTKLHFVDSKPEGQSEFKGRVECFRNYKVIEGLDKTIEAVSHITIGENGTATINTKTFRLAFDGNQRIFEVKNGEEKIIESPKEPYIQDQASEVFMLETKPNTNYSIRASYPVMVDIDGKPFQRGTLYVASSFKRTELKKTPILPHGH